MKNNRHRNTDMNSAASQRALNYNEASQQKRSDDKKSTKRNVKAVNNHFSL